MSLYRLFKNKWVSYVSLISFDVKIPQKLYREAQDYKTKIKIYRFGNIYTVNIKSNFLLFKFNTWLFHLRIKKMRELRKKGFTYQRIANKFGKTRQNVYYLVNKYNK